MASNDEYPLPVTIDDQNKRQSSRHLPRFFRTEQNEKFLSGVLDPLLQPGKLNRVNGYVGRKDIPNFNISDNYQSDVTTMRQYYQLEPGFVYQDPATGEPIWFADYLDYMNSLAFYGANTANHAKLNTEEAYAWDPSIDLDKFVNFREYYWLPSGPNSITIFGHQIATTSTFTITTINEGDRIDYLFTPDGLTANPRLTLYRGNTYTFKINAKNKPFSIKTQPITGNSYLYNTGVSRQNIDIGTITFTVPYEAPDLLYYIDNNDANSQGFIDIRDIDQDTELDVEKEILGKINYTSTSGISFINGLKLKFIGNITPVKYATGTWYVEGVGTAIRLISFDDLESTPLTNDPTDLPFDLQPFDTVPFDNANNYPTAKEYLVINRGSRDRNPWTRNNRWFHISVIETSALANNQIASPDQTTRAQRPIIEFLPDIKLHQFGWIAKKDVDLIDTTTKTVFRTIEGSLGYYVDGEPLLPGQRVLFTADTDPLVNGKIYTVSTIVVNTTRIKFLSAACTLVAPYQVTFTFDELIAAPPINVGYTVEGNSNANYSGLYNAISSTTSSITLIYPQNPGIFGNGITTGVYDNFGRRPQLTLIPAVDSDPNEGEVVYSKGGVNNKGSSFYYDGTVWQKAQQKTAINQAPLFDLFDKNSISFSDKTVYTNTSFSGNRIFGYRIGLGAADTELGFPLYYRSIDNVGDIEFEFDLENTDWNYVDGSALATVYSYQGFLRKYDLNGSFSFLNGWTATYRNLYQKAVRILEVTQATDLIAIDIFNNSANLSDINAQVYVNNIKRNDISRTNINGVAYIKFANGLSVGDQVVYKIQTTAEKNARGYYEVPYNWQNNPFNETLGYFTLGEAVDHVKTIVENNPRFSGNFPGTSNLSTIGNLAKYGHRFLQHAGSFPLAAYLITDKRNNVVDALKWTATQYTQFKKEFLRIAGVSAFEGTISERVDQILSEFSKSKYLDKSAFYFSDMAPCKGFTQRNYIVQDTRLPVFVIDSIFNPQSQTRRSVLIYVNDVQLTYLIDYNFSTTDAFVNISFPLNINDTVTIKDYASTNGSYIPYTPSKLGIYPSYAPRIYIDDTYITPVKVIQGHDGSITLAYNDYRDNLILEIEKRIYNTRRIAYNDNIFNMRDVIGGYFRSSFVSAFFTKNDIDNILLPDFLKWNSLINQDYNSNYYYEDGVSFTYNYSNSFAPDGATPLPGYWRAIYQYMYDTDRPHSHPWEMQGFTVKPAWWDTVYGPAPYTSENKVMWIAIERGIINTPGYRRTDSRYARSGLTNYLPVDDQGNLLSPLDSNLIKDFSLVNAKGIYSFGDGAPVEAAWRRSSEFPFSIVKAMCVLCGSDYIGKMWDRFTIKRNLAGQIYNANTGKRFNTADIVYPNTPLGDANDPNVARSMSNGLANIIDDYVFSLNAVSLDTYKNVISGLDSKLSHRLGAYTSKDKLNVLLDSRSPTASGTVFLPQDNYHVFYNQSSPVASVVYSGVLIEKLNFQGTQANQMSGDYLYTAPPIGYKVSGYDKKYGIFQILPPLKLKNDPTFNIGGVTEPFAEWTPNQFYNQGFIVKTNNRYYRAIVANTSSGNFALDAAKWASLSSLPITGGVTAINRTKFSDTTKTIPYGTILPDIQSVVDFLLGYQEKLKSNGFKFDQFNKDLGVTLDWLTSAKEFMFWSLQNWNSGAIITLSPSATYLQFNPTITASIDDFSSSAFEYSILKADGTPFKLNLIDIHRIDNGFTASPNNSGDGIYFVRANLIQREHVLLLDNISDFNDTVYDKVSGYRQGRVKLIGFKTGNWDGGYTTPGFMYDAATIITWQPFVDYNLGDIVSYKNNNYVAITNVPGSSDFKYKDWKQQTKTLPAGLMANWDYRVEQFRDFYNLDASIFDDNQKKLARHLIGYQDRPYLDNIIIDDVAQFKFYQGFIREKGTFNSITKLFDVLRSSGFSTVNLYEDWAFKVGDYGASDAYTEIEFPLDESQFRHNPQDVVLTINPEYQTDLTIYNVSSSMVTIKPSDYTATPFPTTAIDSGQKNYGIFKYQVAGYVRSDDVEHIIYNRAALLNYDITQFRNGDKIWLAYTENNDWDVLEYIKLDLTVTTWTVDFVTNSHIYLYCDTTLDLARGDVISLSNLDLIDGSYIIQSVSNNIITIYSLLTLATIPNIVTSGVIHRLASVRYKDLNSVSDKIYNKFDISGEKLWIDSDLSGNWLVLENTNAFFSSDKKSKEDEIIPYTKVDGQQNGYEIKISGNGLYMIVSSPFNGRGTVVIYKRPNNLSQWAYAQILKIPADFIDTISNDQFGISLEISYDGQMILVGAPYASNLRSFYKGVFDLYTLYNIGDIVKYSDGTNEFFYKAKVRVPGNGSSFLYQNWDLHNIYLGDPGGYQSTLSNQGVVFVFEYDRLYTNKFLEKVVLASSDPVANEHFGYKMKMVSDPVSNDTVLFVSAKDYSYDIFNKITTSSSTKSTTLHFANTTNILIGQEIFGIIDPVTGTAVNVKVVSVNQNGTTITVDQYVTVSSSQTLTFSLNAIGRVQVLRYNTTDGWRYNYINPFVKLPTVPGNFPPSSFSISSNSQYGYDLDCLSDLSIVAISAPGSGAGIVYVFKIESQTYSSVVSQLNGLGFISFGLFEVLSSETLTNGSLLNTVGGYITEGDAFGYKVILSGNSLIVTVPNNNSRGNHVGAIFNFQMLSSNSQISSAKYQLQQVIIPPVTNTYAYERFGTSLSIDPKGNILSIGAHGGPSVLDTTFDSYASALYQNYSFDLTEVTGINGTGPYYVDFNILPQLAAPAVDLYYTISGNDNGNYNGIFLATKSSETTITFEFLDFPGQFSTGTTVAVDTDLKYILDPNSETITPTTFDNNSTKFYDQIAFTGAVYVYNRFDNNFIYADRITPTNNLKAQDNFGFSLFTSSNCIVVGTPNRAFAGAVYGSVFVFNYTNTSWKILRSATPLVDVNKFKKSFYYNTKTNKLIGNLDLYDPAKGRIPGIADQEIKYQTYYDPAVYQYNGNTSLAINADQTWTDAHIGEIWWDLSTIKYTWYEQGDVTYRNLQWGQLFPGSIVNIYEWVESKYLPSKYATLADTTAGIAAGISGIPKDTSDTTYSTKTKYDKTSGIVTTLYYFWVSNRKIIPSFKGRNLSASDITKLIADPKSQGYEFVSMTSESSLSLINIKPKLIGTNISLNFQFYKIENRDLAVHREYALIAKGDRDSVIPSILENKWFDSLIGLDIAGNPVPDTNLSIRQRYGNSNNPRQSWFVNRNEALKQYIEYVNSVLISYNLLDEVNLTNLQKEELAPSILSGEIDLIVNTIEDLAYIGTSSLRTAQLSLAISNGQVIDVYVIDSGFGYGKNKIYQTDIYGNPILWYGPTVEITGTGTGAKVQLYVDAYGSVDAYGTAEVVKGGSGYDNDISSTGTSISTIATVRDFTVLVTSDSEALGSWSIHTWSFISSVAAQTYAAAAQNSYAQLVQNALKQWTRIKTQSYNVKRYWSFVDWYATGYTVQSDVKHIINHTSDLGGTKIDIGDLVKVTNAGLGNWLLLLRVAVTNDPDFTVDYHVVGQQNATIQFSTALYNYNNQVGYDKIYSYDLDLYDSNPSLELRIILESIRDDIFVKNLKINYNTLFFNNVHYVLSEQHFADWFFKTSFLKLNQIVGNLNQNATFQTDPLADYESYISEVKPYKTKIREFVSSYQGYDYSYNTISDFDLPSIYNQETGIFEAVTTESTYITQYPWANWLENHTYQVTDIVLNNTGLGYISRPSVVITPPITGSVLWNKSTVLDAGTYISFNHNYYFVTTSGISSTTPPIHTKGSIVNGTALLTYVATDASATAYIATGSLFKIVVDNPGYGFISSPIVTIRGGLGNSNTIQATATAFIGNSKSRSITLTMKFDRYQRNYYVNDFKYTDIFEVASSQTKFRLTYAPEIEKSKFIIKVNDIEYYGTQYSVILTQETHDTYVATVGDVVFANAVTGTVVINYYKNINLYSAADRINYAYNPTSGQYGKDLSQLMYGVDYAGTELTSIAFNIAGGWDVLPWDVSSWDTIITDNDDYTVGITSDILNLSILNPTNLNRFTLPYIPAIGDEINIYVKPFGSLQTTRIDSTTYVNPNLSIFGRPLYSLIGVFAKTPSVAVNSQMYTVKVTKEPIYNNVTDTTIVIIDVFSIQDDQSKFQYPKPLTGWTMGSYQLVNNAISYDYTSWQIVFSGNQTLNFVLNSSYSLYPTTNDYLVISRPAFPHDSIGDPNFFDFGTDDFTIEFFVNPFLDPADDNTPIITIGTNEQSGGAVGQEIRIGHNIQGNGVGFLIPSNDSTSNDYNGFGNIPLNQWSHLALVRNNSNVYFFINGTLQVEIIPSTFNFTALGPLQIGYNIIGDLFSGSISNLRILKGRGLYTANFSIPNIPLTATTDTALALFSSEIETRSFIGDGINNIVNIDIPGYLNPGDQIIFRKSTSDGTILPTDQSLLDSLVSGGDLANTSGNYSTARGIAPEEIIVDGDDFVSPETGSAPEELVQGTVVDTVDIRVYDAPTTGGPKIIIDNYVGDGLTSTFPLNTLPPNDDAAVVFVDRLLQTSFLVDYALQTVTITDDAYNPVPPPLDSKVTIFVIDTAGYDILSRQIFVGDGATTEFISSARYTTGNVSAYILIDGIETGATILTTNPDNPNNGDVMVRFDQPPAAGSTIQIMIFRGTVQKYSKTVNEVIPITNSSSYQLARAPATINPVSAYAWVFVTYSVNGIKKQDFLRAPDYENFVYPQIIELDGLRYGAYSLKLDMIRVYKNNIQLLQIRDYKLDNANNIIYLTDGVAAVGDKIIVEIFRDEDFYIEGSTLYITKNYNQVNKDNIVMTTFTNHDQWDIMRSNKEFTFTSGFEAVSYDITQYDTFGTTTNTSGIFDLPRTVSDKSGVLVSISKQLLVPGVDYVILDNLRQVRVTLPDILTKSDYIEIITSNPKTSQNSFGFRIFKDMLNRVQYKRLDGKKTTALTQDLNYYDTQIHVVDALLLDNPDTAANLPGVINIRFERIEYFAIINGNTLSQLRRGTLGTAINNFVPAGTDVMSMSYKDTVPYQDTENKYTYLADTAIQENLGIPLGTSTGIIYGTTMIVPDHNIKTTISINQTDITFDLMSNGTIDDNRNIIKNAINSYSNITGVVATRVVNIDHPAISNLIDTNGIDLVPTAINLKIVSFVSKNGNGPYAVTFEIVPEIIPPTVGIAYTITGSMNTAYNGTVMAISATQTSVTLEYLIDPGTYLDTVNVASFASKVGNGPYFVTFNIPLTDTPPSIDIDYTIRGNMNQNYNTGRPRIPDAPPLVATASTTSTITFRYNSDPGTYVSNIPITSRFSKTGTGPYYVTYIIPTQTTPLRTGLYYSVTGSQDLVDFSVLKNTSFYNGTFKATASTTTSVTLEYPTDPGIFVGGILSLSSITLIYSNTSLNRPVPTSTTVSNVYLLPLVFVPTAGKSTDFNAWYRSTIPVTYGQNDEMEVFLSGNRLNKSPTMVYDQKLAQDSYNGTGDVTIEADFSVDGKNANIRFTTAPAPGATIVILTKKGYSWYNNGETVQFAFSDSKIAKFITSTSVDLPK
jgi:hypothetical protein